MTKMRVLESQQDRSVNFVEEQLAGFLESRYVRKVDDYFVCYLSSQTGCNRGCQFCHLTATGQTSFVDSSQNDYIDQAMKVFKHYRAQKPAKYVHFSFMARGEPMANEQMVNHSHALLSRLGELALDEGLASKFCVSTIMPKTLHKPLLEVFPVITPTIYYSLYSMNTEWRAKWMPGAMDPREAIKMLAEYQRFSKKLIKVHHTLIAGENDSVDDAYQILDELGRYGLRCEFNLVRYNPASPAQGREAGGHEIDSYIFALGVNGVPTKIVPRVGFDVKASCGMFVQEE